MSAEFPIPSQTTTNRPVQSHVSLAPDFQKVVWFIDADPTEKEFARLAASALKPLAPNATIVPIYGIDPEGLSWNGLNAEERVEQLRPAVTAALEQTLEEMRREIGLPHLTSPLFVAYENAPLTGASNQLALKLLSRARKVGADLILMSHHGQTGLSRLLHTSMTELILRESEFPVLVVNAQTQAEMQYRDLIFPTDFSAESKVTFERTLKLAGQIGARVRLFHKRIGTIDPLIQSGVFILGGSWVSLEGVEERGDERTEEARLWAEFASREGVELDYTPQDSPLGVADSISAFCKTSQNPLLVMTARGNAAEFLWGNMTNEVLKLATCPILVLRAQADEI